MLFLDLDGFKMINDSPGPSGREINFWSEWPIVWKIACVRPIRWRGSRRRPFTVARMGGDEFTVLLDDLKDPRTPIAPPSGS